VKLATAGVALALVVTGCRVTVDLAEHSPVYLETTTTTLHPADNCHEDEAYTPVDYLTPGALEDVHGVTRVCVNLDEINN